MNKFIYLAALVLTALSSQAQGPFVFVKGQYQWGTNQTNFEPSFDQYALNISTTSVALGGGWNAVVGGGYFFSKYVGIDLSANYHGGSEVTGTQFQGLRIEDRYKTSYLAVIPSFVANVPLGSKIKIHVKSGLVIPAMINTQRTTYVNGGSYSTYDISSKFNIGFNGMVGFSYKLTKNLDILVEVEEFNLTSRFQKATLKSTSNSFLPTSIDYVDEVTPTDVNKELSYPTPFNSVGFNLGLRYNFKSNEQ